MKSLQNKETAIKKTETEFTNYVDLAKVCINDMPQGGLDVSQMKARLDVMTALDKANGEVKFTTKAQVETLKNCVTSMRWAIMHEDVVGFVEAVEKLD